MSFFKKPSIESLTTYLVLGAVVLALAGGGWLVFGDLFSHPSPQSQVRAIATEGGTIDLSYTDENEGEDLIIYSDRQTYTDFSHAEVYFAITPKKQALEKIYLQFLFPPNAAVLQGMEMRSGDSWQALEIISEPIKETDELFQAFARRKVIPNEYAAAAHAWLDSNGSTIYLRARISYPPGSHGEFWIEAFGDRGSYGLLDPWYDSSWTYRKPISVNPNQVSAGLADFPMLVSWAADGHLAANAQADDDDIVFTDSDGSTVLDYEIEKYTSSSGALVAWVKMPYVSSTSTRVVYMYYGNASATDQQDPTNVWDSNYKGVWHLKEDPTTTCTGTKEICDSTSNDSDGDNENLDSADQTTTQINGGMNFDSAGSEDITLGAPSALLISGTAMTISAWVNADGFTAAHQILTRMHISNAEYSYASYTTSGSKVGGLIGPGNAGGGNDQVTGATTISAGTWYHYSLVKNGTGAGALKVYLNGAEDGSATSNKSVGDGGLGRATKIGASSDNQEYMDGLIDEVRISATARSADWILTEYRNQYQPGSFYGVSGPDLQTRAAGTPGVKIKGGAKTKGGAKFR